MEIIFVMLKSKKYTISGEVLKYPYCAKPIESDDEFLLERICCHTIKIRKKITKKFKWLTVYADFLFRISSGIFPCQAIGLATPPQAAPIMRSTDSGLSKEAIINQVIKEISTQVNFTEKEINQLFNFSIECKNNSLSQEELMNQISKLRGGSFIDIIAAIRLIGSMIILMINGSLTFQPNPNAIVPPHLQWLYNDQQPGNNFGYGKEAGPRSITVTGLTKNAGSEKDSSSGSWDYVDIMRELDKQINKKSINIQIAEKTYNIRNPYRDSAFELSDNLAEQIYDSIRKCDTDICDIAQNLGFKADNIKNVKDHVFYNEHDLDRYGPDQIERKRFDATLSQALAWKRLEAGVHTQDDVIWIKHECAERHQELKYDSGYSEAHDHAQSRFDGAPWENNW